MDDPKAPEPLPPEPGFWSDLISYARTSKRWWLIPVILVLLFVGMLLLVASGALPFVYTLF